MRPMHTEGRISLSELMDAIATARLEHVDPSDEYASPIHVTAPFDLRLDWWLETRALKVWAGSMRSFRIARAMQAALRDPALHDRNVFNRGLVVRDVDDPDNKVEPYYFDARRGASAQPLDIGFSPDKLGFTTAAFPATEFLCLVGLQRCRPRPTDERRIFDYFTWSEPLPTRIVPAAICGLLPHVGSTGFRFESAFRTDQRKHKAFTPAKRISRSDR
jgi:CRISPR-associated protein Csb3